MITDEVYEKLVTIKDGRSFSELLDALATSNIKDDKEPFRKIAGIITDTEAKEIYKRIKEMRKLTKVRFHEVPS